VHGCYSYNLSPTYKVEIEAFRTAYLRLGISVTPKIHIIFVHLSQFIEETSIAADGKRSGLGLYSEQAGEALHAGM
jgi:hypothetical protein